MRFFPLTSRFWTPLYRELREQGERMERWLFNETGVRYRIRFAMSDEREDPIFVSVARRGTDITVYANFDIMPRDHYRYIHFQTRLGVALRSLLDPAVKAERFDVYLDDGDLIQGRSYVGFSAIRRDITLIPDFEFVLSDGYADARAAARLAPAWKDRSSTIRWRGSTTGWVGDVTAPDMSVTNMELRQRIRLCLAARGIPGTDVKIHNIAQTADAGADRERLIREGIFGDPIPANDWANDKFAFGIDGNSNSMSNLYVRMLLGCCVLNVDSQHGYRLWYFDDFVPWTHYVPVAADLSDLAGKIDWCRNNEDKAETIAKAGQEFTMARTVKSEVARTAKVLNERFAPG